MTNERAVVGLHGEDVLAVRVGRPAVAVSATDLHRHRACARLTIDDAPLELLTWLGAGLGLGLGLGAG